MIHTIQKPTFAYNALEPYFDAATMEIHTEKHHQTYADKLNAALADQPNLQSKSLDELLLLNPVTYPLITNMSGGVWNHNFFWSTLSPQIDQPLPQSIDNAIRASFDSFDNFKTNFTTKATSLFGSGWTWLVLSEAAGLEIINLPNQDNPLAQGKTPLLALDLWEHAYYLKYQNRRAEYIDNFWHIINWAHVDELLESAS